MHTRAWLAVAVSATLGAVPGVAQQAPPSLPCLEPTCLRAVVPLAQPTLVLLVISPNAEVRANREAMRRWHARLDTLVTAAREAGSAEGFAVAVRDPDFAGFAPPVVWQAVGPLPDEGYVLVAPSRRLLMRDAYLSATGLAQWLRSYASPYFRLMAGRPVECGLTGASC